MSGYDLANVKRIERENGHLRDVISELRREIAILKEDPARRRRQALSEGDRYKPANPAKIPAPAPLPEPVSTDFPYLTRQEARVFVMLRDAAPNAVSRENLYSASRGHNARDAGIHVVSVVVARLRQKIAANNLTILMRERGFYSLHEVEK